MKKIKGCIGCITGIIQLIGFFLALSWPILLLFDWAIRNNAR